MSVLHDIATDIDNGSPVYQVVFADTAGTGGQQNFYVVLGSYWDTSDLDAIMSAIKSTIESFAGETGLTIYSYSESQTNVTSSF